MELRPLMRTRAAAHPDWTSSVGTCRWPESRSPRNNCDPTPTCGPGWTVDPIHELAELVRLNRREARDRLGDARRASTVVEPMRSTLLDELGGQVTAKVNEHRAGAQRALLLATAMLETCTGRPGAPGGGRAGRRDGPAGRRTAGARTGRSGPAARRTEDHRGRGRTRAVRGVRLRGGGTGALLEQLSRAAAEVSTLGRQRRRCRRTSERGTVASSCPTSPTRRCGPTGRTTS